MILNSDIQNIYKKVQGNLKAFHEEISKFLQIEKEQINAKSLHSKAQRTLNEIKRLSRFPNKEKYFEKLKSEFIMPSLKRKEIDTCTGNGQQKNKKQEIDPDSCAGCEQLRTVNKKLSKKLKKNKVKVLNQKLKRSKHTIQRLQATISSLRVKLKESVSSKEKLEKKKNASTSTIGTQCNTLKSYIDDLKEEIDHLYSSLEDQVSEDNEKPKTLNLRDPTSRGNPYDFKLRKLLYEFRSRNIPAQHINPLIKEVLSLVDMSIEELPHPSTVAKLSSELGILSRSHIISEIQDLDNLTIHRDATTKKGRHYYGVEISTNDKTFTAGLREVVDGKADTYVSCVKEIFTDACKDSEIENFNIISNVSNFMTDRSATEQKVNNILEDEKKSITNNDHVINSFKCSVHPLLQFSDVCEKEISRLEKDFKIQCDVNKNESATLCLLRFISKYFFKDGCGDPVYAPTYLKDKLEFSKVPVMRSRGNRFNTLFYNAAGTFYVHKQLLNYLQGSKSSLNFTESVICTGLSNSSILCIVRALGILNVLFTAPYWNSAEVSNSAIEMGSIYRRVVEFLDTCLQNPGLLLHNKISLFYGPSVFNEVSSYLFLPHANDDATSHVLECLCTVLKDKCVHLFKDFLIGGKFYDPPKDIILNSQSCPPNNINVERLMAKLDASLVKSSNFNVNTMESIIMFKNNKTSEWLKSKSEAEQCTLITKARKRNTQVLKEVKERKFNLFKKHLQQIREREKCVQMKKQKKEEQLNAAVEKIKSHGLWSDRNRVQKELEKLPSKKEKVSAMKEQINLLKTVFVVNPSDKHLTYFSKNKKTHDLQTLIDNFLTLMEKTVTTTSESVKEKSLKPLEMIGKQFKHMWTDQGQDTLWEGKIISYEDGIFKVKYWEKTDSCEVGEEDQDIYELTESEILADIKEGNLSFTDSETPKPSSVLDHSYSLQT